MYMVARDGNRRQDQRHLDVITISSKPTAEDTQEKPRESHISLLFHLTVPSFQADTERRYCLGYEITTLLYGVLGYNL